MNRPTTHEFFLKTFSEKYDLFKEKITEKKYVVDSSQFNTINLPDEFLENSYNFHFNGNLCTVEIPMREINLALNTIPIEFLGEEENRIQYFERTVSHRIFTEHNYTIKLPNDEGIVEVPYKFSLRKLIGNEPLNARYDYKKENLAIFQSLNFLENPGFKKACLYVFSNIGLDSHNYPFYDLVLLIDSIPLELYNSDINILFDCHVLPGCSGPVRGKFMFPRIEGSLDSSGNGFYISNSPSKFNTTLNLNIGEEIKHFNFNIDVFEIDKGFESAQFDFKKKNRINALINYFNTSFRNLNVREIIYDPIQINDKPLNLEFSSFDSSVTVSSDESINIGYDKVHSVIAKEESLKDWPLKVRKCGFSSFVCYGVPWQDFYQLLSQNKSLFTISLRTGLISNVDLTKLFTSKEPVFDKNILSNKYIDDNNLEISVIYNYYNPRIDEVTRVFYYKFLQEVYSKLPFVNKLWEEVDDNDEHQVNIFYKCFVELIDETYLEVESTFIEILESYVGNYLNEDTYKNTDFYPYFKTLNFSQKWDLAYNLNKEVINEESLNDFPSLVSSLLKSGKSLKNVNKKRKEIFSRLKWEGEEPPKWIINKFYKGLLLEIFKLEPFISRLNKAEHSLREKEITQEEYDKEIEKINQLVANKESEVLKDFLDVLKLTWGVPQYRNIFIDAIHQYPNIFSSMSSIDFIKYYYFATSNYAIYQLDNEKSSNKLTWYGYNISLPNTKAYCINNLSLLTAYSQLEQTNKTIRPQSLAISYKNNFTKLKDAFNIEDSSPRNYLNTRLESCNALSYETLKEKWNTDVLIEKEDVVLLINTIIPLLTSVSLDQSEWIKLFNKIRLNKTEYVSNAGFNQTIAHAIQDSFYVYTYYSGSSPLESKESFSSYIKELRTWCRESLNLEQDFADPVYRLEHYLRQIKENVPQTDFIRLHYALHQIDVNQNLVNQLNNVDFSNQLYTSIMSQLSVFDSISLTGASWFLPSLDGSVNENCEYFNLGLNDSVPVEQNIFEIKQILDKNGLGEEGKQMKHCVGGYTHACQENRSFIFKVVPLSSEDKSDRSTIEFNRDFKLVQNRSYHNNNPSDNNKQAVKLFERKIKRLINSVEDESGKLSGIDKLNAINGIANLLSCLSNLGKVEKQDVIKKKIKEKERFVIKNNNLLNLIKNSKAEPEQKDNLVF